MKAGTFTGETKICVTLDYTMVRRLGSSLGSKTQAVPSHICLLPSMMLGEPRER